MIQFSLFHLVSLFFYLIENIKNDSRDSIRRGIEKYLKNKGKKMDILVKFVPHAIEVSSGLENRFDSLEEVQEYFLKLHEEDGNNNFFFHTRKRRFDAKDGNSNTINENENIYFIFNQKIIAKARYVFNSNPNRNDKFKNGYKVKNVIILGVPYPLSKLTKNPFSNQNAVYFVKDEEDKILKEELKEIFEQDLVGKLYQLKFTI